VLGSVVRLARRTVTHASGDLEESVARAVEAAWRVIRNYPAERNCRPLDGISLDVLGVLTDHGRSMHPEIPSGMPADLGDRVEDGVERVGGLREAFWTALHRRVTERGSDEELIELFAWGVQSGVISRGEARLLLRLHSPDEPGRSPTCRDVAEHLGIAHDAVRQRASRATRRLAAAVQAFVRPPDALAA
jgi:hypothetical protein